MSFLPGLRESAASGPACIGATVLGLRRSQTGRAIAIVVA